MTKSEFERYKRYAYEYSDFPINGYITVHIDCPQLTQEEKEAKFITHLGIDCLGKDLIKDNCFSVLTKKKDGSGTTIITTRLIPLKWVSKCQIWGIGSWKDEGGKRERKIDWFLKNLKNDL